MIFYFKTFTMYIKQGSLYSNLTKQTTIIWETCNRERSVEKSYGALKFRRRSLNESCYEVQSIWNINSSRMGCHPKPRLVRLVFYKPQRPESRTELNYIHCLLKLSYITEVTITGKCLSLKDCLNTKTWRALSPLKPWLYHLKGYSNEIAFKILFWLSVKMMLSKVAWNNFGSYLEIIFSPLKSCRQFKFTYLCTHYQDINK